MRIVRTSLAFLLTSLFVVAPFVANAQIPTIVPCTGVGATPCTICHLATLAQNLLNAAIYLAVFLSAILFSYAGWLYLTNEAIGEQQKAKGLFRDVVMGLCIILGAWLFVDTLMKTLMGGNYFPWNSVCGN